MPICLIESLVLSLKDSAVYKQLRVYSIIIYYIYGTVLAATSFLLHPSTIAVFIGKPPMVSRFKFL